MPGRILHGKILPDGILPCMILPRIELLPGRVPLNKRFMEKEAMVNPFSRTEMIFGKDGMEKL